MSVKLDSQCACKRIYRSQNQGSICITFLRRVYPLNSINNMFLVAFGGFWLLVALRKSQDVPSFSYLSLENQRMFKVFSDVCVLKKTFHFCILLRRQGFPRFSQAFGFCCLWRGWHCCLFMALVLLLHLHPAEAPAFPFPFPFPL